VQRLQEATVPTRPQPQDHKRKKPIQQRVRIFLEDDPIEALNTARAELAEGERHAQQTYERRLTIARTANPPATELLDIEAGLHCDREAELEPLQKAVEAAEDAALATSQEYVFRSIGPKAFHDLIAAHEPTDEDHDDQRLATGRPEAVARWHSDTFIPALIAASCTSPKVSVAQATEMYEEWNDAEVGELFAAALVVNQGARRVDLGKALQRARTRG
jgi:hypothetical protein